MRRNAAWIISALLFASVSPAKAQRDDKTKDVVMMYPHSQSFLGVAVAEINAERAKTLKMREEYGVEITRVEDDSPASKAGLTAQDVVLEYQGQRVEGIDQFIRLVRETPSGRQVKMLVFRNGQPLHLTAAIASRKARSINIGEMRMSLPQVPEIRLGDVPRPLLNWRAALLGIEAESLNSQLAEYFGVEEGVLVRSVSKGSAGEQAGLRAGDVIVKVEGKNVSSPSDVTSALRATNKTPMSVTVVRDKKEIALSVTVDSDSESRPRGRVVRNREFQF